eukprot:COSAG05_NODE_275_length_12406_cov_12.621841_12_plen_57_part_00
MIWKRARATRGCAVSGALWTPISDLAMIEENVDKLISQLALAAGNEPRQVMRAFKM